MRLALIYDKSLFSRHERGYVASLKSQGVDPLVVLLDESASDQVVYEEVLEVDGNIVKVPVVKLPGTFTCETLLIRLLLDFEIESIITLPRKPYMLAYKASRRLKIPLIVRFWSIRALKLIDNLKYGAYGDLLLFMPSLASNLTEVLLANGAMVIDNVMYNALQNLGLNGLKPIVKIYPPAGFRLSGRLDHNLVGLAKDSEPYIFGMTVLSKRGAYLKFEAKPSALLFYHLAKRIPQINFLIGGSTSEEFAKVFTHLRDKIPKNLIFLGRGFTDDTLKYLYQNSIAAVSYISNRSISNRLLEAIALNAPVVTNTLALTLHPELAGSVIVARDARDYEENVEKLIRESSKREELREKVRRAYARYFSPKLNYTLTLKIVNLLKQINEKAWT
ncbi:MAG: glycosyltransferase [Thermosphaera sp.]